MADVRALLKSKRQEQRITHTYASYTQSGLLKCKACDIIIKSASAWNGHVISKGHRTAAAKLKEEEALAAARARKDDESVQGEAAGVDKVPIKRRKLNEDERPSPPIPKPAGFPADFFSDPMRKIYTRGNNDETEDDNDSDSDKIKHFPALIAPKEQLDDVEVIDREWAAFQLSMLHDEEREVTAREVFDQATVFAEPELVDEPPEGIPQLVNLKRPEVTGPTQVEQLDEAQALKLQQEEERELIMDKLVEEERYQEEADERVSVLKARLELIKHRRVLSKKLKRP